MSRCSMKNIIVKNIREHVVGATDSKSNDLVEDLINALSNFMTALDFQCKISTLTNYANIRKYVKK